MLLARAEPGRGDEAEPRSRRGGLGWLREPGFYVAVLIAAVSFGVRLEMIESRGPYPQHRDERHLANRAFTMLKSGDPNPHFFKYGSLPIYLTAGAMGAGAAVAKLTGSLQSLDEVSSVGHPYYSHGSVSLPPRWLFAFISVLGLFAVGALARHGFGSRVMWVSAPCALMCSELYLRYSWSYLNVDVLATALCLAALAHLVITRDSGRLLHRAVVPALFCGAVTATKYNSGVLGVPFVLAILMGPRERRIPHLAWLFGLSLVAYAVCSPYTFVDWPTFVSDVRYEMEHYRTGHARHDGDPGWPQLSYYANVMLRDYGAELVGLGLFGVLYAGITQPKTTLWVLSFPVAMLLHMATNRVHFPRTVLPAYGVFAAFIGVGAGALVVLAGKLGAQLGARLSSAAEGRRELLRAAPWAAQLLSAGALVLAAQALGLVESVREAHRVRADSRILVAGWLADNAPEGCLLLLPVELPFDARPLAGRCELRTLDATKRKDLAALDRELSAAPGRATLLVYPRWDRHRRPAREIERVDAWERWRASVQLTELTQFGGDNLTAIPGWPTLRNPALHVHRLTARN